MVSRGPFITPATSPSNLGYQGGGVLSWSLVFYGVTFLVSGVSFLPVRVGRRSFFRFVVVGVPSMGRKVVDVQRRVLVGLGGVIVDRTNGGIGGGLIELNLFVKHFKTITGVFGVVCVLYVGE